MKEFVIKYAFSSGMMQRVGTFVAHTAGTGRDLSEALIAHMGGGGNFDKEVLDGFQRDAVVSDRSAADALWQDRRCERHG